MAGASSVNEAEHPELVHWDNLEGQDEEGVGGAQDGRTRIYLWPIHADVWRKTPQYCKVITLQLK